MEADAPVLTDEAIGGDGFYIVGLIGGKDVGKSALVNALVGREITARTSHGAGTAGVIAYAHVSQVDALKSLLEDEAPGRYRIVTHEIDGLRRQVLVDLPDIDSHYQQHVELVRRMLRHMLFPIWMQSIEKYADVQPQELLKKVAAGNSPANFVFALNKVDQLRRDGSDGVVAMREITEDYARRIARVLDLDRPPRVWMISALQPDEFDLPELREELSREKTGKVVEVSRELAARQQGVSLLRWVDGLKLDETARRIERLQRDAEEMIAERVGVPLLEQAVPGMMDDASNRLAMIDECLRRRVARWPLVGLVHTVMWPVVSVLRRRLSLEEQRGLQGAEALADMYLRQEGRDVADLVQSTFAHLQQSHPAVTGLYARKKLWEQMNAESAATNLRKLLAGAIERQRAWLIGRVERGGSGFGAIFRWGLTLGAVAWFPVVQPVAEAVLKGLNTWDPTAVGLLVVQMLGVTMLLKNAAFLVLWFGVLWAWLRWNTQRRVDKQIARWKSGAKADPGLSLHAVAMDWMNDLLEPIRERKRRIDSLLEKTARLAKATKAA
jgi:hypothetical protein